MSLCVKLGEFHFNSTFAWASLLVGMYEGTLGQDFCYDSANTEFCKKLLLTFHSNQTGKICICNFIFIFNPSFVCPIDVPSVFPAFGNSADYISFKLKLVKFAFHFLSVF